MIDDDVTTLARLVGEAAARRGAMLATAESCTGGGIAEAITRVAGSSAWFERGFVTYSNAAKCESLGVRGDTLAAHGAVSEAVACEMAEGALRESAADACVAVTGVAGPRGGSRAKPVGTVWLAWAGRASPPQARRFTFAGDRAAVRRQAVAVALQGLVDLLG